MLGVCYYPEHWPRALWREDARRMSQLGLTYVRVGEFAWSRLEPTRGRFDWGWLDEALGILADAGLRVVMCTPTAAPPKWLVDERPEILPWDAQGRPRGFGSRRHSCFASPAWREETQRICEIVADRYGEHPGVAGWQLDNEYGCHGTVLSFAPHCRPAFQEWLEKRYGAVEALNDAWGTVFWSQEYRAFGEVELPVRTVTEANPAHRLDYHRFGSDTVIAYNRLQAEIVRKRSPDRFIAHNSMGLFFDYDHYRLMGDLDVIAWDSYPLGFTNQRLGLSEADRGRFARAGHPDVAAFHHDLYRGIARAAGDGGRWWVMEQQPGPVNWADHNPAPADGMIRLWTWQALAHGAEAVSYFRWRQAPFGQEQMHAGLNRPDNTPDIASAEAARVAEELRALDLSETPPLQAPVALVFDYEAAWVLEIQPQGAEFRYHELLMLFYGALRRLGVDVDVVPSSGPFDGYGLVVVPTLPILEDRALAALAACDATVLLGPRTGSKTPSFQIPEGLPPGALRRHLPLTVWRVESLPLRFEGGLEWQDRRYPVRVWREAVESNLQPGARFEDGGGAVFRAGRWHYLAFWPDGGFLIDYCERLLGDAGIATSRLPETLALRRCGEHRFAFNTGDTPARAPAGNRARFVLGGAEVAPYDLAVWVEDD